MLGRSRAAPRQDTPAPERAEPGPEPLQQPYGNAAAADPIATVGLDAWADDPRTENGYRAEREQVTGERTDRRSSYAVPTAP